MMKNLIQVASRFNNNIDKLTTRLVVNDGLRQFCDDKQTPEASKPQIKNKELQKFQLRKTIRRTMDYGLRHLDDKLEAEKIRVKKAKLDTRTSLVIAEANKLESKRGTMLGTYLRVFDEKTAQQFADLVMSKPANNPAYVVELNSGLGLMTTRLLDAGLPTINLFECVPHFYPILDRIAERYPGRVCLKKVVFDHLWRIAFVDFKNETNQLPTFLEGLDRRKWSEEPTFHIIGALTSVTLIARYMMAIVLNNSLAQFGRVVFHVAMPPSLWNTLSADNSNYRVYSSRSIMFQTLFRYELLGTLPRASFSPKYVKKLKIKPLERYDKALMCVARIEARSDLYNDEFTESDSVPFFYFIKHHLKRRTGRIIPELEKWIPGCGRRLIAAGFTVTTEFGELLPQELLKLFLQFKSWPEYKKSSFVTMLDSFEKRLDEQMVFGTTADKVDEMFKLSRDATNARAESVELNDASKYPG